METFLWKRFIKVVLSLTLITAILVILKVLGYSQMSWFWTFVFMPTSFTINYVVSYLTFLLITKIDP